MLTIIKTLKHIIENFNKTPNRGYSANYILEKKTEIQKLEDDFNEKYEKSAKDSNQQALKKIIDNLLERIKEILNSKTKLLEEKEIEEDLKEINEGLETLNCKMAKFDIISSIKIIPEFGGEVDKLTNFLNLVEYVDLSLSEVNEKEKLIKFVLGTKLSEKVRNKLITVQQPKTFKELKKTFCQLFRSKKNTLQIISELSTIQQNSSKTEDFASKVEKLVAELNSLQLLEQGDESREIICKINDQLGLNAFKNGLQQTTKSIVFSARPKTLSEAIDLAAEIDSSDNFAQVNHFRTNSYRGNYQNFNRNNNIRFNRRYQNNNTRNNSNTNNNNSHSNNSSNMRYYNNNRYNSNNKFNNNRYNNTNYNTQNQRRINYVEGSENIQGVSEAQRDSEQSLENRQ